MMLHGILNLAKPAGITSRRAVDRVQRLVRPAGAGHAGTLDPLATGVLVVGVGRGTRLVEYVQRLPKSYEATFLLGRTSDTEDVEGTVVELINPPQPTGAEIDVAAQAFRGAILQRPPAYSALKVQGRRAYDLARSGQNVELAPRPIEVYSIERIGYDYPELRLRIRCGSGTYVRSLGRDLAESLGTGAVMSALVRTAIGRFTLADAIDPESLTVANIAERMQPLRTAVDSLPTIAVDADELRDLGHGKAITRTLPVGASEAAALDVDGRLVSILREKSPGLCVPVRNFFG